jgi:predicted phosphodiesterase
MKKYLFLGDTHGDVDFLERVIEVAQAESAEIIQLGDWGYWWPGGSQPMSGMPANYIANLLLDSDVTMRFIDGNHDWHPKLQGLLSTEPGGGCIIAPGLIYQPRGSTLEDEDGTRFLFCGGAPSIDKAARREGYSWWPEEEITDDEHAKAMMANGPIHVLVTHDAPGFPPGYGPLGSPRFQAAGERSMGLIRALVNQHQPELLVHGHWHERYSQTVGVSTRLEGIDCNLGLFSDSWLLWNRAIGQEGA